MGVVLFYLMLNYSCRPFRVEFDNVFSGHLTSELKLGGDLNSFISMICDSVVT